MDDLKAAFTSQHHGFKQKVLALLRSDDFTESLGELNKFSDRKVINSLFSFFSCPEQTIKWRAVSVLGALVAKRAEKNIEAGREIVRRLMWSLNNESGSCGWSAPEAMGEIMACHEGLAKEYAPMLRSYISKTGNYLDHPLLQHGVLWGLGRLAQWRPDLVQDALKDLSVFLVSHDALLRGLAVWTLGFLNCTLYQVAFKSRSRRRQGIDAGVHLSTSRCMTRSQQRYTNEGDLVLIQKLIETLLNDHTEIGLYVNQKIMSVSISDLTQQALARL